MLQLIEGFENSRVPAGFSGVSNFAGGRTGGIAWRAYWGNAGFGQSNLQMNAPTPVSAFALGAAGLWRTGNDAVANRPIILAREGATTHLQVCRSADGTTVDLRRGDNTILGVAPVPITTIGIWNHYELEAVIADAPFGSATLRINGSPVVEVEQVDTRNGGTSGNVSNILFQMGSIVGGNDGGLIDDIYFTDTTGPAPFNGPLGDTKVEALRPNANGDQSAWLGSDGNSVDNYLLVDDVSTTTDYVGTNVNGARDLYNITNPAGVDLGDILAVQVEALVAKSDAGNSPGDLLVVEKGADGTVRTDVLAIPAQIATSWQWFRSPIKIADPGGDPWTLERLNALQVGVEIGPAAP